MNNRYIIKCIALKNIETQRTSDDNIIAGKEYWYNPEAQSFWTTGQLDLMHKFYPYKEFPRCYIPVTKLENNAKIFKKLATAKDHVKTIENTEYFKCEIYRMITVLEKI
jgi:hypothetical protein